MASPSGPPPLPPNIGTITSSTLIGSLLNFFLFGTLLIQVCKLAIKRIVYFVFLCMALCTCLNAADAHYWYASGFGDIVKFGQAGFSPSTRRSWVRVFRTNAVWATALIALASFVQAAGGIGGGIKAYIAANEQHDQTRTILVHMWLVGDAVADIGIAVAMTHLLTKATEPQTRDLVRGVVRLVIETNMFCASVAIIGLVLFAALPTEDYFICLTMILPGIYANTLLVLLNNRASPTASAGPGRVLYNGGATLDIGLGPFVAAPREGAVSWGSQTLDLHDVEDQPDDSKWR
ncbi:hypothetical protein B0H10DRAFT_2065603 [Mycena sp. CBHHK59/15]|nr:hypothetical protein B0H10DRAFT_2065603 [Mycena sp. CBHHK59/15]